MTDKHKKPDFEAGVPAADIAEGAMLGGSFGKDGVLVARRGGRLFAVSSECTHLGGPLAEGLVVSGEVRCPWHQARFSLETGEAAAAPALQPLGCYAVEERGGKVFITGKREAAKPAPAPKSPGRVVIVGGGAAGHACADMLARHGFGDRVTVISEDADAPYDRTFCSKQYLSGESERSETDLDHNGVYQAGVTLKTGLRVTAIDPAARTVATADGVIPFDALVLATGAAPIRPDIPGFDHPRIHLLRTLKDADALVAAAAKAKRVAIVGASFIGLEVAAAMIARKLEVTVIAPEPVPLARILGVEAGRYVQGLHADKGVVFHLGRKVEGFDGEALSLDDGATVEADLVILGVGVKPRLDLARAAGLALADEKTGGVAVDARLQTSAPGVYAAGDIAAYPDPRAGTIRVEHWAHAERQGQHVARVLMGLAGDYSLAPFFWTNHYDGGVGYIGHAARPDETKVDGDVASGEFAIEYFEDGRPAAMATSGRDQDGLTFDAELDRAG